VSGSKVIDKRASRVLGVVAVIGIALVLAGCPQAAPPPPAGDFSLTASPQALSVQQGESDTVSVTVVPQQGFNAAVALSAQAPAGGVTVQFNPETITPGTNSTATITVAETVAPGSYPITISGTAGNQTRTTTVTLTVTAQPAGDFSLALSPQALSVQQGGSDTVTVTVEPEGDFDAPVALSAQPPAGVTVQFDPETITPGTNSTATITVAETVAPGGYPITISGTAGNQVRTANLTLTVTEAGPPPGEGAISGTVTAPPGADVAGTLVIACGEEDCPAGTVIETSGNSAAYTIPDVPAGQYAVFAWNDVNGSGELDDGDYFGCFGVGEECEAVSPPATGIDIAMAVIGNGPGINASSLSIDPQRLAAAMASNRTSKAQELFRSFLD
jgi:uncharacterized protein (DUF2141 family)